MQVPAALLAIPILVGVCAGLLAAESLSNDFPFLTAAAAALTWIAAAGAALDRRAPDTLACTIAGSMLCGLSLGTSAAHETYAPPLLAWFGKHKPSDPVVIEGTLRGDASPTPFGVSITVDVTSAG